jgi:hypothetical protein
MGKKPPVLFFLGSIPKKIWIGLFSSKGNPKRKLRECEKLRACEEITHMNLGFVKDYLEEENQP